MTLTSIGKDVTEDPCWQKSEKERKKLSNEEREECKCLGPNIVKQCQFPGIEAKYDPVVDSPQPEKPQEPGTPPERPQKPKTQSWKAQQDYERSLDKYQDELEDYQKKVDEYQEKIDQWQEEYSEWKGKYESAIGEAEGIIGRFHKDYGSMFDVDLTRHWGIEGFLIAVMFSLLLGVQKRKDII